MNSCARSPLFETAANSDVKENKKEMVIKEKSVEAVKEEINFIYGINIREGVTDFAALLDIAEYFLMADFKIEVDKYVVKNLKITEGNYEEVKGLAELHQAPLLADKVARYCDKCGKQCDSKGNLREHKKGKRHLRAAERWQLAATMAAFLAKKNKGKEGRK